MISTEDGEFYPEKNLDRSYKIPKRNKHSDDQETGAIVGTTSDFPTNHSDTPLQDSYYNYPYDPRASSAYYQNYPYFQEYGSLPGQGFYRPGEYTPGRGVKRSADFPGPNLGATALMDDNVPIEQSICDTLKGIKETPKTQRTNIFERTVPDIADKSLPKELKLLFQPLYCKLCSVQLSSNQTAIMHYKAKTHDKKIRKWLTDWAAKTGKPLPKRATAPREKKAEDVVEKNPSWFHCDVCDLELTGQIHAESHYMGKNHQKALLGYKTPAGAGYYDKDGKWVRIKHLKSKSTDFEKGADNFGADFKKNLPAPSADAAPQPKKEVTPIPNYHCKVCNIYTTHPDILENHFKGQKHAKKLKHLGIAASGESKSSAEATVIRPTTIATAIDNKTNNEANLTAYRTPSGLYYCAICNTTINSEYSFLQHLNSKGHDKKSQLKPKGTG